MRILISHPDTIGDFVLRQPMLAAVGAAGHEVMLIVRDNVRELAAQIAPMAVVEVLPRETYAIDPAGSWHAFEPTFAAARAFAPDLYVIAPYRWTPFEEELARRLPEVPRAGLAGRLYSGDPYAGLAPQSSLSFDLVAGSREDDPELQKNAALASVLLGRAVEPADPVLAPPAAAEAAARARLGRLGLTPREFWVACVGGTAHVAIKTWQPERWAIALSHWARTYQRRFLFVGLPSERPIAERVRTGMKSFGRTHAFIDEGGDGSLADLQAVLSLAAGYVGHDTGPMHLAAALGRPVLGVFGGGTWPRFRPAVSPSVAVMVKVPCVGCGWSCRFAASYCIKAVPADAVIGAIDDLEAGRIAGREARVLEPTDGLEARIVREALEIANEQIRVAADARQQTTRVHDEAASMRREFARVSDRLRAIELERATAVPSRAGDDVAAAASGGFTTNGEALAEVGKGDRRAHGGDGDDEDAGSIDAPWRDVMSMLARLDRRLQAANGDGARSSVDEDEDGATPVAARPRMRARLTQWAVGMPYLPPPPPPVLPAISIVIPTRELAGDGPLRRLCRTIDSLLGQNYANLEVLVADGSADDGVQTLLSRAYGGNVRRLASADHGKFDAVHKGLTDARGQLLGYAFAGDLYLPGSLARAADDFLGGGAPPRRGRHRGGRVLVYECAADTGHGWLRNVGPLGRVDALDILAHADRQLRAGEHAPHAIPRRPGVFFTRVAYASVGGVDRGSRFAGDWDFLIRLARMFGLTRGTGTAGVVDDAAAPPQSPAAHAELLAARDRFVAHFGRLGRARVSTIHRFNRMANDAQRRQDVATRLAAAPAGQVPAGALIDPVAVVRAIVPNCPLTGRPADRLLLTVADTLGRPRPIYYSVAADVALIAPPGDRRAADAGDANASAATIDEPPIDRALAAVSSPKSKPRVLDLSGGAEDVLAAWRDRREATITVIEPNATRANALAEQGHTAVIGPARDAALLLPAESTFDIVLVGPLLEATREPLALLRRLRGLLAGGGAMLFAGRNLGAADAAKRGAAWPGWAPDRRCIVYTAPGLAKIAAAADYRIVESSTVDPAAPWLITTLALR